MVGAERAARPEPVVLRAAQASVRLDLPTLRSLSWCGVELVQSVPATVRDRNWGNVPGLITELKIGSSGRGSRSRFVCTHDNGDVGFVWEGEVSVISSNPLSCTITYSMVGRATRNFTANRIGFCVLHPLSVAGNQVSLRSAQGTSTSTFPRAVSPHQTFLELTGMSYSVGDAGVDIRFDGGVFETEDQRNWTDASFKTYSPPLRLPFPRVYRKGEQLSQEVVVQLTGPPATGHRRSEGERPVTVRLGGVLPAMLPAIGIGISGQEPPSGLPELEDAIRRMRPSHLHAVVEPHRQGWQARLHAAAHTASAVGAALQCEVVVSEPGQLEVVVQALAEETGPLSRVMVFDKNSSVTTPAIVSAWLRMAKKYDFEPSVFAGSRANFAELNRNEPPYELISGLTFPVNPQVHAFGDDEIVATLPVQELVARQAAAMARGLPLHVGPVTLKPRFNAVATDDLAAEPEADSRQSSWWAAGWTLGSLAALARGGAASVTYFNTSGPDGLLYRDSSASQGSLTPYPALEVLCRLAPSANAHLLATHVSDERQVTVLALSAHDHLVLFVANLSDAMRLIRLDGQASDLIGEQLGDERLGRGHVVPSTCGEVELGPYALVLLAEPSAD